MAREIWKLNTLVLFYSSVIKVWDLRRNYAAFRQDPLPVRSFCYPGTSTRKLGKALGMDLFECRVDLRSTASDISYLYSQLLIRLANSAGYFDCQYQIFKLKSEHAQLLYHCPNDKNLQKLQQCIFINRDEEH